MERLDRKKMLVISNNWRNILVTTYILIRMKNMDFTLKNNGSVCNDINFFWLIDFNGMSTCLSLFYI